MEPIIENVEIIRYVNGEALTLSDPVIREFPMQIQVNGAARYQVVCTGRDFEDFVVGYLFADGLIRGYRDIRDMQIDEEGAVARVEIPRLEEILAERGVETGPESDDLSPAPPGGPQVSCAEILDCVARFTKMSPVFLSTGCAHSCALCDASGILRFAEDISRHNALDKAIGYALIHQIPLDKVYAITSGRVPSDMIDKFIRAGVPIVVSRSAPTAAAVEMAKRHRVTLIGFARDQRMNIYAMPQRVICNI